MEYEFIEILKTNLQSLIGQKISSVRYVTIDYFDDKPYWDVGKIHEVEHGVEFTTELGENFQISWDDYENDYGVYITNKKLRSMWNEESIVIWNVSERTEWEKLLNQKIYEIKTYWHEWDNEFTLQDIELEFINGAKVWFVAARFDEKEDQLLPMSDDISIIFEEPIAYKYKVGNYTNDKSLKIEIYK